MVVPTNLLIGMAHKKGMETSSKKRGFGHSISNQRIAVEGEDCQNLNVWTPRINDGKKRPVMVWLHGGGFQTGSSIEQRVYDGANLSRKGDVVVVSVNHRLNMLGFLDLSAYGEEYKYSGNVGTMDMVAALKWIQTNIEVFGGDPDNNRNTWSQEEVNSRLKERFGNHSEAIVEAFKQAYPERPIADVLYVETMLRAPALKTARLKADQHGAPVYNYMFAWDTPLEGGFAMSYHCSELPFVFNNVVMSKASAVGGKQAEILADRMSRAWINFARYGNPNHSDIPDWPAFTRENGYTMIFGNECQIKKNHDYKLMKLLVPDYVF